MSTRGDAGDDGCFFGGGCGGRVGDIREAHFCGLSWERLCLWLVVVEWGGIL